MLTLYTDGSCLKNPGPGGWAFLALSPSKQSLHQQAGPCAQTTNNQMELQAVIEALKWAQAEGHQCATVITDSRYVQQGMLEWIIQWKRNGWRTSTKGAVKNQEYWQQLDILNQKMIVKWQWVKAHHIDEYNATVDRLAREAATSVLEQKCL